jgi:hypothetical protein
MADAHITGIKLGLTDEELDERLAACKDRKDDRFEKAEGAVESTCTTIEDADMINYALTLGTHVPTSCSTSEPCDYSIEETSKRFPWRRSVTTRLAELRQL